MNKEVDKMIKSMNIQICREQFINKSSYKIQISKKGTVENMDKKQAQAKEQIAIMLRKKDYYDILGVAKTANQAEIKKAYKKLALKFHPDKNSHEGAKQVFKKVSNAYTVLINPEQKERYDRFGPQQQQVRYRPHHHAQRHTGDDEFDEFDEIFRAFFGMNGMQMNRNRGGFRYTYHAGGNAGANNYAQGQRNQGFGFHYLFILIFLFYAISPLFKTAPYHSLSLDSTYRFKVNSDVLNTQYYVRQEFFDEVKKNPGFKSEVDLQVDEQYLIALKKTCEQATRLKKTYEYRAYQYSGEYRSHYLAEANRVDTSSCRKIDQLYKSHPDYVSQLYYYR